MELKVQVEKASNITRKLTIQVPAPVVAQRLQRGLQEVQRTAKLKGFRPGHVPMNIVKQFYGDDVRHRVFHNLIDESFQTAVRDQKIQTVGRPTIETPKHKTGEGDHDHTIEEGQELVYTATVEVLPEIDVKGYLGVSLTQESATITDKDVETVIANLLNNQAELIPVTSEKAKVKKGQFVDMTFKGGVVTDSGVEEKAGMSGTRVLEVGSDSLIPGFEDELIGMTKGETKTFQIPFPKDFHEKDLAGKPAEFTVTVSEIKDKKLPELNDELVKQMGYESVEDLRKKANEHLVRERNQEVDRKLRSDLLEFLIEKNPFEVPGSLIEAQTRALAQDVAQNLKGQGADEKMTQEILMGELENIRKKAENQVRASLIIEAIAKKEKIEVTPKDLDAEVTKVAGGMRVEPEKLREFYAKNPGRMADLEFRVREERTIKHVLDQAKIKKAK